MDKFKHYYLLAQAMLNDDIILKFSVIVELSVTDEELKNIDKKFALKDGCLEMQKDQKHFKIKLIQSWKNTAN